MTKRKKLRFTIAVLAAAFAMNAALWLAGAGIAHPRSFLEQFFGPRMVRAEVIVRSGNTVHEYRIDQGRVHRVKPREGVLTLAERDGTIVDIQISPTANIQVNRRPAPLTAVRRGMPAITVRDGDGPAEIVRAGRR